MQRVVVTGLGIVSCLGNSVSTVIESLRDARSGIGFRQEYADLGMRSHIAGAPSIELSDFIDRKQLRFMAAAAALYQ